MNDEEIVEAEPPRAFVALKLLVLGLSGVNIYTASLIPKFRRIFQDMLGEQPLPFLSAVVIGHSTTLLVLTLLIPALAVSVLFLRKSGTSAAILGGLNLLILIQITATIMALFKPLVTIVTAVQAP